jgi:hypothetical protein
MEYFDDNCNPRVKVPPDSIWVTYAISSGNLVVNDKAAQTFADDSTDGCGFARVTIPSLSGCGTLSVSLYVSGVFQGSTLIKIRSTDTNADGRTLGPDATTPCDLTYDGTITNVDRQLVNAHVDHWRRNALHGTMVRRTNYCETCPEEAPGVRGGSEIFWSPSGRYISHTQFIQVGQDTSCKVFIVPSDPNEGNALTQFSFAPNADHDYDPSWSPRNDFIAWDRADRSIIRKPVPWFGDQTEVVVTTSNNPGCLDDGDNTPAISPDGEWVAFSRCNGEPTGGWSIWKISINGGTAIQLTPTVANASFYPSWSPNGQTIYFQLQDENTYGDNRWTLWKVPAAGGPAQPVLIPPGSPLTDATQPALSPDGKILLTGYGLRDLTVRNVIASTLDPGLPSPTAQKVVPNYADTNHAEKGDFPELSPRLSPDGTRTALGSKQIWAVRRNMTLPPRFVSVTSTEEGTRSIADTAATMSFTIEPPLVSTITVSAVDPEGDALTYSASFLQSWMIWNSTGTLTLDPVPGTSGKTFYVKFWVTTPSGGTDSFIAAITVHATLGPAAAGRPTSETGDMPPLANPTTAEFAVPTPATPGVTARLTIFDLSGRRVAVVSGPSGVPLVWDGRDTRSGALAPTGIYIYRMEAGDNRREGKVSVVR